MPLNRQQKEEQVKILVEKIKDSKSVTFANFSKISVKDQTLLRNNLRSLNAEMKVAKKNLLKLAVSSLGISNLTDDLLEGQTVIAFSYEDPVKAPQVLKKKAKTLKTLSLTGGIFENKILSQSEINELADLPSREVLLAKLMGSMTSSISNFASVSQGVVSGFVRVLDGHVKNQNT
jgi:large subunit ribosomal protein L10